LKNLFIKNSFINASNVEYDFDNNLSGI
jgi:hypothetical protein